MFSRPVSSWWKPVPTSSRLPTRPWISALPVVGSVMRERILSSVLLPAPLRPMMPTTSPASTSKLTSFRAQIVLTCPVDEPAWRRRRMGAAAALVMASRSVVGALLRGADLVPLAEPADADGVVAAHTTSAKMRSMRRK